MTAESWDRATAAVRGMWLKKWWIAGVFIAGVAISVAYALTRIPSYQSSALLAPVQDPSVQANSVGSLLGRFAGVGDALGIIGGAGSSTEESVALMESRQFTEDFLKRNGILPYLFPDRWDESGHRWRVAEVGGIGTWIASTHGVDPQQAVAAKSGEPSPEKSFDRFVLSRDIVVDRRTGFVKVNVRGPTPGLAQAWATALIRDANARLREKALIEVRASIALLTERLESLQYASVKATTAALLESYIRREVLLTARSDYALSAIDPPNLPEERYYPHRTHMVVVGALLGLLSGILVALAQFAYTGIRIDAKR